MSPTPTPIPQWGKCVIDGTATLNCIPAIFQNLVYGLLLFAGITTLFFIILSGLKFMNSGGDPKQLEGARNTLIYAIIGLLVILFSFLALNLISYITGVECIKFFGFECE